MKKVLVSISMAMTMALVGLGLSATPYTPAPQAAEAASYRSCSMSIHGVEVCYQYNCNWWEWTFQGCRDGWVYMGNVWYAEDNPASTDVLTSA